MDTLTAARIADLPRPERCDLWRRSFKAPPPPQINRPRLVQLLAFEAQVRSLGGLDHKTRRAIARLQKQMLHPGLPGPAKPRCQTSTISGPVQVRRRAAACVLDPGGHLAIPKKTKFPVNSL